MPQPFPTVRRHRPSATFVNVQVTLVPTPRGYKGGMVLARRSIGRGIRASEVSTVTSGYGQVASGHWVAVAIGAAELLILVVIAATDVRRELRRRHTVGTLIAAVPQSGDSPDGAAGPPRRCWALIAEAVIAHERMSGHIDAATYQARMSALVTRSS